MNIRVYIALLSMLMLAQATGQNLQRNAAIEKTSKLLSDRIDRKGRKKLAILDVVESDGRSSELGRTIARQVTIKMTNGDHNFVLVDEANRARFIERMRELNSGIFKPEDVKKLGNMSGADTILYGELSEAGGTVTVNFTISTIDSGEIIGGAEMSYQMTESDSVGLQRGGGGSSGGASNRPSAASDKNFMVRKSTWSRGPLEFTITNFQVNGRTATAKILVKNKGKGELKVGFDCDGGYVSREAQAHGTFVPQSSSQNAKLNDSSGVSFRFAGIDGIVSSEFQTPYFYLSKGTDYSGDQEATVRSLSGLGPNEDLTATLRFGIPGGRTASSGDPSHLEMSFSLEASFWYSEEKVRGVTIPELVTPRFDDLRPKS